MKKRQSRQTGMTLIELLVSMAITAMLVVGIGGLIYHEVTTTNTIKNIVTTTQEITSAAHSISKDAVMAESTDLVEGTQSANQVTLSWTERLDFVNIPHTSSYYLSGTDLQRDYDNQVNTVARNISKVEFSQNARMLTVSISCTSPWRVVNPTVEKTYCIYLRPMEEIQP